jgi:hypothetical protein
MNGEHLRCTSGQCIDGDAHLVWCFLRTAGVAKAQNKMSMLALQYRRVGGPYTQDALGFEET